MSKKRANKSKRRRESQQPAAAGEQPRLKLVSGMAAPAANAPDSTPEPRKSDFELASDETRLSDPPDSVDDHEHETRFFDDGHKIQTPHAFSVEELDLEVEAPKPSPKMTPVARARRAHFSKYVKGAMVAATAILALAGIRAVVGHADRGPQAYANQALSAPGIVEVRRANEVAPTATAPTATVGTTGGQVAAAPELIPPPQQAETPKPEAAKVEAPKVEAKAEPVKADEKPAEKSTAPEPAKVEAATPAAAPAPAPVAKTEPVAGALTAAQEKVESRKALERGKAGLAIEAGERSVALDPTDGEAWLILGAAYQEKGNVKDARRAFQSCTKEGKRGPISECRAMLQ